MMAMKGFFTFLKALGLEPHHRMQFIVLSRKLVERSYPSAEMQSVYSTALTDWDAWFSNFIEGHTNLFGLFNVKAIL